MNVAHRSRPRLLHDVRGIDPSAHTAVQVDINPDSQRLDQPTAQRVPSGFAPLGAGGEQRGDRLVDVGVHLSLQFDPDGSVSGRDAAFGILPPGRVPSFSTPIEAAGFDLHHRVGAKSLQ